ncbi:YihY/virulence factor BrkB family protein [Streptomyces oceani]|uniref:Uncharacterized protein n=1 Tax=Streptomyces oceani TaxID=1075402 RepID=A0A1E7KI00_9ACTN|nr:YihY/virulence factor BrkB family protein [Streptomyces oceani]OEV03578.1 hypothetical protein AN216_10985 [Streptomyces oceani]
MDWLTKLPVIGPVAAWFFRTRVWRVYEHLEAHKWQRLTAAITFTSFLALFPMIVVGIAAGAAFLSRSQVKDFEKTLADQVPGISGQLDIQQLADHAGAIGLTAGALLLFTGVGWVGTLRECLRAVWDLEEDPGNPVLLKLKDLGALIGLGAAALVSVAGSAFALAVVGWLADRMGLDEGGVGRWLLRLAGYAVAIGADFLLLWYVLRWLPRVRPERDLMVAACLIGAVGFELLKLLLGGYLQGVAAKNTYGAFGTPIALLLWISFMARLLLYCAGWTATERVSPDAASPDSDQRGSPDQTSESSGPAASGPASAHQDSSRESPRPKPEQRPDPPRSRPDDPPR